MHKNVGLCLITLVLVPGATPAAASLCAAWVILNVFIISLLLLCLSVHPDLSVKLNLFFSSCTLFRTLKMSIFKAIPRMSSPSQGTSPKQLFFPKHTGASDNWPYFLNYMCEDQMGLCLWPQVNLQCLALEFLWTVFHRCPFLSFGLPGLSVFLGGSFLSNVGRIIS